MSDKSKTKNQLIQELETYRKRIAEIETHTVTSQDKNVVLGIARDTTKHKRTEEAFQESEYRFQTSVENMIDCFGIYSTIRDESGGIVDFCVDYVNEAACVSNRMTREEQIGKGMCELLPAHRETGLFDEYCEVVKTGSPFSKEELVYEDVYGDQRLVRAFDIRISRLGDGFAAAWRDITERKRTEEELRQYERIVSTSTDMLALINKKFIYLAANKTYVEAFNKTADEVIGHTITEVLGEKFFNTIIKPNAKRCFAGEEVNYQVWFEFPVYGRRYMDVTFYPYYNEDKKIIGFLVNGRNITVRKKAEEDFENIFNLSPDMVGVFTPDGKLVKVNPAWEKVLGYKTEEFLNMGWAKFVHPDDVERTNKEVERQLKGSSVVNFVNRYKCKDGSYKTLEWQATFAKDGIVHATARDITERKATEEALRKSEERYRAFFTYDLTGDYISTPEGKLLDCNPAFLSIFGFKSLEEAKSKDLVSLYRNPGLRKKMIDKVKKEKVITNYEHKMRKVTGEALFINQNTIGEFDEDNHLIRLFGCIIDVTERKQTEQAIAKQRNFLQRVIDTDPNFIFVKDRESRFVLINQAVADAYGSTIENLIGKSDSDFNSNQEEVEHFHRDDIEVIDGQKEKFIPEEPITTASGEVRWLQTIKKPLVDEDGVVRQLLGVSSDITERRRAEEALRKSEEKFRLLFEDSKDAIYISAPSGKLIEFNPAMLELFGYSRNEMLKLKASNLYANPEERNKLNNEIDKTGFIRDYNLKLRKKDGVILDCLVTSTIKRNIEGSIIGYQGIIRDISELKQNEKMIIDNLRLLSTISGVQSNYISNAEARILFDGICNDIIALTDSEFGFIGEVFYKPNGDPYLTTHSVTNIAWNVETKKFYKENAPQGMEFHNLKSLFGAVLTTRKPVISNNSATDPRRGGLPKGHPPLHSFLGLPLFSESEFVGMIGLANRPGGYDQEFVDYLDPLLLSCGNIFTSYREGKKRKQTEKKIKESQKQLRALARRLQEIREEERTHLARELHDELGSQLTIIKIDLMSLLQGHTLTDKNLRKTLTSVISQVDDSLKTTKRVATELRPGVLDQLGLKTAIKSQLIDFENHNGIKCKSSLSDDLPGLKKEKQITLFRILQEALTNIARHAGATNVKITLNRSKEMITLTVQDDGKGFKPSKVDSIKSLGLLSMHERAYSVGGELILLSQPGVGTTITASIPLE